MMAATCKKRLAPREPLLHSSPQIAATVPLAMRRCRCVHEPRVDRSAHADSAGHCAQPRRMKPTPVRITSAPIASAARSSRRPKPTSAALIASAASSDDSASVRTCQPLASSSAGRLARLAQHPVRQPGLAGERDGDECERRRARLHDGWRGKTVRRVPDHLRAGYDEQRAEARERERFIGRALPGGRRASSRHATRISASAARSIAAGRRPRAAPTNARTTPRPSRRRAAAG